jgi:hypothetical protein
VVLASSVLLLGDAPNRSVIGIAEWAEMAAPAVGGASAFLLARGPLLLSVAEHYQQ